MLFLRTCDMDGQSYGGFQWDTRVGAVNIAPDWKATSVCGNGLHGLPNGQGDVNLLSSDSSAIWLVVDADNSIDLNGKHKFRECIIKYSGDRDGAVQYLVDAGCTGVHFSTVSGGKRLSVSGGDWSIVSGGYGSTVSGGDYSTVSGGDKTSVSGGNESTVSGGYGSTVSGGDNSTVSGGYESIVSGGDWSTVTGGNKSAVSGGDFSTVTGGYKSTVSGGNESIVYGGYGSIVSGGLESVLNLYYHDANRRRRIATAHVGENGIKPNTKYRLNEKNEFEEVLNKK